MIKQISWCISFFLLCTIAGDLHASYSSSIEKWQDETLYLKPTVNVAGMLSPLNLTGKVNYKAYGYMDEILEKYTGIKELDLSNNKIDKEAMKILSPALQRQTGLHKLIMSGCQLDSLGCLVFAMDVLEKSQSLAYLDLSKNAIEGSPIVTVSEILVKNTTLKYFDLSENPIEYRVAHQFCDIFMQNKKLEMLKLRKIGLNSEALAIMGSGLQYNHTLLELDISHNHLGDSGGFSIANILASNKTLKALDISNCDIGEDGIDAIATQLQENKSLRVLLCSQGETIPDLITRACKEQGFRLDEQGIFRRVVSPIQ